MKASRLWSIKSPAGHDQLFFTLALTFTINFYLLEHYLRRMHARTYFALGSLAALGLASILLFINDLAGAIAFAVFIPLVLLGIYDIRQKASAIRRNYPLIGRLRYFFESIRPEMMQYFVETDTEGRPFNRIYRSMVYQRAKKVNDTSAFGTQVNVYRSGYEWMDHSLYAVKASELNPDPRVMVGEGRCSQPYSASIFNVSAMSFGSLSKNAVSALNYGAKKGGFGHNTGEGGISPYHLEHGGDLIWQVGTGYFGCRADDGGFSMEKFIPNASRPEVKMVEVKLSQGAKPGHGGILPAKKNTKEIAAIRGVEPFTDVHSPPGHTAFSNPIEMLQFITDLREACGGKPIGIKLCIGREDEFEAICQAIVDTGMCPDFISVDGGEGGTGAAPVEFSNHLGAPLRDGLVFVDDTLKKFGIRDQTKINATGKVVSGFHIARAIALGADFTSSARAMMMAVGCIQALQCNRNTCPTGVATQNSGLMHGLDPINKGERVYNYHHETVHSLIELLAAAGLKHPGELSRKHIKRRVSINSVKTLAEMHGE